jgi:hypothetical protein
MDIRFFIREGVTRTFLRDRGEVDVGMVAVAICVTGSRPPFPIVTNEWKGRDRGEEVIPELDAMWEDVQVSKYQSIELGGWVADAGVVQCGVQRACVPRRSAEGGRSAGRVERLMMGHHCLSGLE